MIMAHSNYSYVILCIKAYNVFPGAVRSNVFTSKAFENFFDDITHL